MDMGWDKGRFDSLFGGNSVPTPEGTARTRRKAPGDRVISLNSEDLLGMLNGMLSPGITKEDLAKVFGALYSGATEKYLPLLGAMPAVAGIVATDLAPVITTILVAGNTIAGSEEMLAQQAISQKRVAKVRGQNLKAYLAEGFTRKEAMSLLLLDSANAQLLPAVLAEQLGKISATASRKTDN